MKKTLSISSALLLSVTCHAQIIISGGTLTGITNGPIAANLITGTITNPIVSQSITGTFAGNGSGLTNLPSTGGGRTISVVNTSVADQFYVLPTPGSTEYCVIKTNAAFTLYLSYGSTTNTVSGDNVIVDCVPASGHWFVKW